MVVLKTEKRHGNVWFGEAKEETGLDVNIERLLGIYSKTESNDLVFMFKCRKISGVLTTNEEAKELRYFNINDGSAEPDHDRGEDARSRDGQDHAHRGLHGLHRCRSDADRRAGETLLRASSTDLRR